MNYFDNLTTQQKTNIAYIIKRLSESEITNDFTKAAILSICSKESAFTPKSEKGYGNTPNERIRRIFGSRLDKYTEAELFALKSDDEAFFNAVYGGRNGNAANEGFKYRGRALNQLTFKNSYDKIGKQIGVDLINNPDKANQISVATDILIQYFKNFFAAAPLPILAHYNSKGLNDFKTLSDAVKAVYHANAGWGKSFASLEADVTGGRKKALDRSVGFYEIVTK
jgi:predicted chitinase